MEASEENEKINRNNNDFLLEIIKELERIIEYIQINLIKNKDINFNEIQKKKKGKLGVKRKKLKKIVNNDDKKDKNEINLNEKEEENENYKILLKNKKLKTKLNKFGRCALEIVKIIKNILNQINDNKNKNLEEFKINNNQEIIYNDGKYIGNVHNGLREGKGVMYYNNGNRYEGDFKNDNREGKGIYYYHNGDLYEGDFRNDKKEGKGVYYYHNGDLYEGDWRNDNREGKGIFYYNNGDR